MTLIGDKIKESRTALKLTQKELAEKVGLATITIRKYESNQRTPKYKTIQKLALALNVSPKNLLPSETHFYTQEIFKFLLDNKVTLEQIAEETNIPLDEIKKMYDGVPGVSWDNYLKLIKHVGTDNPLSQAMMLDAIENELFDKDDKISNSIKKFINGDKLNLEDISAVFQDTDVIQDPEDKTFLMNLYSTGAISHTNWNSENELLEKMEEAADISHFIENKDKIDIFKSMLKLYGYRMKFSRDEIDILNTDGTELYTLLLSDLNNFVDDIFFNFQNILEKIKDDFNFFIM